MLIIEKIRCWWNTKASGQVLPLFRAFFQSLVCCPQARLRTFPGYLVPGTREHQLHGVAISLVVSAVCGAAGSTASDQTGIFDAVRETMLDHRVVPVAPSARLTPLPARAASRQVSV